MPAGICVAPGVRHQDRFRAALPVVLPFVLAVLATVMIMIVLPALLAAGASAAG